MAGKFQQLYEAAKAELRAFHRARDDGAAHHIITAAMCVINRHGLVQEFTDELLKNVGEHISEPKTAPPHQVVG